MSVSSLAITTTGTGVAVFAVLGLKTSVLVSLYDEGTAAEVDAGAASRAAFQLAGSLVAAWMREPFGSMERAARAHKDFSRDIWCGRVDEWVKRIGQDGCKSLPASDARYFSHEQPDSTSVRGGFLAQFAVVKLNLDAHSRPT